MAESYLLGDIDRGNYVTASDVVALRQAIVSGSTPAALFETGDLDWVPIDAEGLKRVYDRLVTDSGVRVLFGTQVVGADCAEGKIRALITARFSNKIVCPSDVKTGLGQWGDVGALSQLWNIVPTGGGYYLLQSPTTGKVLTLNTSGDIMPFEMAAYTGSDAQKVKFRPSAEEGYWNILIKATGEERYMGIPFAGLTDTAGRTDGWPFWMEDGSDTENKQFRIVPATAETATLDAA